jgi:Uma2 family endonuclease
MIATHPPEATFSPINNNAENRVLLRDITWDVYEVILNARGERRSPRLSYCEGLLEIMAPLEEHENSSILIDKLVCIATEETGLELKSLASTTLNRIDLRVGAEPDQCYYIANELLVRGKTVDLQTDPPPDLVIEVDITHTNINKNTLYAAMGVPEFWRFNGEILRIYYLQEGIYQEVDKSLTFPWMTKEALYGFLENCRQQGENSAKRSFRNWVREQRID